MTRRTAMPPRITRLAALVAVAALTSWATRVAAQSHTLVDDGEATGCIVTAEDADERVLDAAHDLRGYIEDISDAEVPILTDAEETQGFRIFVGSTRLAPVDPAWVTEERTGSDGFVIRSVPGGVVIAGRIPFATANGVYHFAEEILGVHWFSVDDEGPTCPQRQTIAIPDLDLTVRPHCEWRGQYYSFQQGAKEYRDGTWDMTGKLVNRDPWWRFNRMNSPPTSEFGCGHSYDVYVPADLFKEHPQYFPLVDYRFEKSTDHRLPYANIVKIDNPHRKGGVHAFQRCFSNPEVLKLVVAGTRKLFDEKPNLRYAPLSINDGPWWCRCDNCKAMGPTDSHRYLAFCNAVAEANETLYPDRGYVFLAYEETLEPPVGMKVHRNLIPMIATLRVCRAHPISSDCPDAVYERRIIEGWSRLTDRIAEYAYVTGGPFTAPSVLAMAEKMRFMRDHGHIGGFREHYALPRVNWEMLNWMEVKLMWDPDRDAVKLRRQFIEGHYGPAAAHPVERVYDTIETLMATTNVTTQFPEGPVSRGHTKMIGQENPECYVYWGPIIAECRPHIDAALAAVQPLAPDHKFRLRVERDMQELLSAAVAPEEDQPPQSESPADE